MRNIDKEIECLLAELDRELAIFNGRLWGEIGIGHKNALQTTWSDAQGQGKGGHNDID